MSGRSPLHLRPESSFERALTRIAVATSILTGAVYLAWRASATGPGASMLLWGVLLAVEAWFALAHLVTVLPALGLPIRGSAPVASMPPVIDVLVVCRDEPVTHLETAVRAVRSLRGVNGIGVVNRGERIDVAVACDRLGIRVLDPRTTPELGIESGRRATALLMVPAASFVSTDLPILAAGALEERHVGAVAFGRVLHGLVSMVGTRGYHHPTRHDEVLAARLDNVGLAAVQEGPLVFSIVALRSVGGVAWSARDPLIATALRLEAAGWRTRFVSQPASFALAPVDESSTLEQRGAAMLDLWDARRAAGKLGEPHPSDRNLAPSTDQALWRRLLTIRSAMERWAVIARLAGIVVAVVAVGVQKSPLGADPGSLLAYGGTWYLLGALARERSCRRRRSPAERMRVGFRSMGIDLLGLLATIRRTPILEGSSGRVQAGLMTSTLLGAAVALWSLLRSDSPMADELGVATMGVALLAIVLLVHDAATAYRQERGAPRVSFTQAGSGVLAQLSSRGANLRMDLPVGARTRLHLRLPAPAGPVVETNVSGTVKRRDSGGTTYVAFDHSPEVARELSYFCAVAAPVMRLQGREPDVELTAVTSAVAGAGSVRRSMAPASSQRGPSTVRSAPRGVPSAVDARATRVLGPG